MIDAPLLPLKISIHALHEESDRPVEDRLRGHGISIHALHEESDEEADDVTAEVMISIHALHEESDQPPWCRMT